MQASRTYHPDRPFALQHQDRTASAAGCAAVAAILQGTGRRGADGDAAERLEGMFYFHIGAHKTGSTTLQRFILKSRDALAEEGIEYPAVGMFRFGQHRLAFTFHRKEMVPDGPASPVVEELVAYAKSREARISLFSSEELENVSAAAARRLVDSVRPHDVRVLLYVRDYTKLIPSRYSQVTKGGGNIRDIDEFIAGNTRGAQTNLYDVAERWAAAVGWDNMRVRALDPRALDPGGLVPDALRALDVDPSILERCDPKSLKMANVSPHWIVIEALRAIGRSVRHSGATWSRDAALRRDAPRAGGGERQSGRRDVSRLVMTCQKAVKQAGLADRPVQYLTPDQHRELARRYQADIEKFAAAGLPRLPDADTTFLPERPFLPSIEALSAAERRRLRDALAAALPPKLARGELGGIMLGAIWDAPITAGGGVDDAAAEVRAVAAAATAEAASPPSPAASGSPRRRSRSLVERLRRLFAGAPKAKVKRRRRRERAPASPR